MRQYLKEHWKKLLCMAGFVILVTVLTELLWFNKNALFQDTYTLRYDFSNGQNYEDVVVKDVDYYNTEEKDGKTIQTKGLETDYIFSFPESKYVKKLHIIYDSPVDFSMTLNVNQKDGYGNDAVESYYDQALAVYQDYYNNINTDISSCTIRVVNNFGGTIHAIEFSNELMMNPYRMLFIAAVLCCLLFLILGSSIFRKKLEVYFAFFCLLAGSLYILFGGTLRIGWDEQDHFNNTYKNSFLTTAAYTEAATVMKEAKQPYYNTIEERTYIGEEFNELHKSPNTVMVAKERYIPYNQWSYLPQSLFLFIGRLIHLPFTALYLFGKFGNLLFYTLIVFLAIRYAKTGKIILAVIGLLPTCIFQATVYSYDAVTISFTMLGFVLWMNEIIDKKKKLKWYNVFAIAGCFIFASLPKAIYIVLLALMYFFPKEKFVSRKQRIAFTVGISALLLTIMYTFLFPLASNTYLGNMNWGGDSRNEEATTGSVQQLQVILSYPWTYTKLLLSNIFQSFCDYVFGIGANANFAFLGAYSAQFTYLFTPVLLGAGLIRNQDDTTAPLPKKYKFLIGILLFGVICLIWTALYMSFTQVGALSFSGVQPRYYLPIMALMLYLLQNKTLVSKAKPENYNRLFMTAMSFSVLYGIYTLLLPYNL